MFNFLRYFIVVLISLFFLLVSQEQSEEITAGYTATLIDFDILGNEGQLKEEGDEDLSKLLKQMHNDKWRVLLNSSADFVANRRLSYAKNIRVNKNRIPSYVGNNINDNVLGVRVNFPFSKFDASVEIAPTTEFSFYVGKEGAAYLNGKGVIHNVSVIKSIHAYVKGRNFPLDLYINLENSDGEVKSYYMGDLKFDTWRELTWENPDYIPNVKQRQLKNKTVKPIYPILQNYLRLKSIKLKRRGDSEFIVSDSVTYFAWIKVIYDKVVVDSEEEEIDDESNWGVYQSVLTKSLSKVKNLRYLKIEETEKKLMNFKNSSSKNQSPSISTSTTINDDLDLE